MPVASPSLIHCVLAQSCMSLNTCAWSLNTWVCSSRYWRVDRPDHLSNLAVVQVLKLFSSLLQFSFLVPRRLVPSSLRALVLAWPATRTSVTVQLECRTVVSSGRAESRHQYISEERDIVDSDWNRFRSLQGLLRNFVFANRLNQDKAGVRSTTAYGSIPFI